ncbi:MAG: TolC family protein [Deltaproteobacteria bacterium]|nr:TolC family protein [Deltaproteobacteria bacterium]
MLGSFKKSENARKFITEQPKSPLKWGCNIFIEKVHIPDKGRWYRVCLGPFENKKEALRYKKNLRSKNFSNDMIPVKIASQAQPASPSYPDPSLKPALESIETESAYSEKQLIPDILGKEVTEFAPHDSGSGETDTADKVLDYEGGPATDKEEAEKGGPWAEPTDGALAITLEKATLLALENNWEFRVERFSPDIQKTYEESERAAFDPILRAEGGWQRDRDKIDSVTTGPVVSTGVSEFLPTGTWLDLDFGVEQENKTFNTNPDEEYETNLTLTVTQALLRGRGLDVNLASLRQARIDTRASEYQLRGLAQSLLAGVENAYWDYTLAKEEVKIYEASVELGTKLVNETIERIELGQIAKSEIFYGEAETAKRRQDLIDAQSARANARLRLLRLLNPPGENFWQRKVVLLTPPERLNPQLEGVDQHIKVALLMRPDLNQARLAVQRNELEVVKTKNGLLPKLDFFVSLGRTGYASSFGGSVSDFSNGEGGLNVYAGLRFEFPIVNRAPKALHKRSTLELEQQDQALENMAQLAAQDVLSAYVEIARSSKQIVASSATVKYQKKKLWAEVERYRFGKSTMFRVAQTERDLVESQVDAVRAVADYLKSLTQFYLVEGSLLVRRGISAPGREPVDLISEKR